MTYFVGKKKAYFWNYKHLQVPSSFRRSFRQKSKNCVFTEKPRHKAVELLFFFFFFFFFFKKSCINFSVDFRKLYRLTYLVCQKDASFR